MEESTTTMKTCRKCGERKPVTAFYRNKQYPDGYKTICKACELKLAKERREKQLADTGAPKGKAGRPKNEAKRKAAQKANENKAHRPNLNARNAVDIVKQLEADRQPWILMKYPYTLRLVKDLKGICYEVVIWQTCESDHGYSAFEMDAQTAREVIAQYGLTERKRYKSEGAIIWAKNDKLQELHQRYVKTIERMKARAKSARDLYMLLAENRELLTAEEYITLRNKAADAEQSLIVKRNKYIAEYPAKNDIIIYNL